EQKGRAEGGARILLEQLTVRFGAVPAKVSERVHAADEATLSRWAVRVLSAPTLKDVLDEESGKAAPARKPAARRRARGG
ncbi:MAG TPA: hypothetical protein VLS89_19285, partial [Candidatus Nanopelagicales bacterium]|nr:hypothetical protein [Candidatus Nanopelagicales bacterium]